jgi:hypothetical protein
MRCRVAFLAGFAALCALAQIGPPAQAAEGFALTIVMDGTGTGTVECRVGEGPVEACDPAYPEGTELTLVPSPEPDSEFVEFSGDCGPAVCELTMSEARSVTAIFDLIQAPEFSLTVKTSGTGTGTVECQVGASPIIEACDPAYPEGTELTLVPIADLDSEFLHFSGACSGEECDLTMEGPRSVTAVFGLIPAEPEYSFTLKIKGTGSGSVLCEAQEGPEKCKTKYPVDTELLLHPEADPGSEFAGFSGACSGPTCEVTLEGARGVTATFNLIPLEFEYVLSVERLGAGTGTVTTDPAGIDCGPDCSESFPEGTKVTLTATPAPGSAFDHWTGGGCTGSGTCKVTMNTARKVKAVFTGPGEDTPPVATDSGATKSTARAAATAKVKAGKALLRVSCPRPGACKGRLKLLARLGSGSKRVTIGSASFSLAPGAAKTLRIGLSRRAMQALGRHRKRGLRVRVKGSGVEARQVRLKIS